MAADTDAMSTGTREMKKQKSDVVESSIDSLNSFDMWAVGITIVIGGQYFGWNAGLSAGVGSSLISLCLVAIGYICLVYCIAELSSGLPFAGGNYGLARVTAGIFPGYLVGCYDALSTITYVASSVLALGATITELTGASQSLEPLYWAIFYITAMAIHCYGGRFFWKFNMFLALVSLVLLLVYILGAARWANFSVYAVGDSHGQWFKGGLREFTRQVYISTWFFVGVEGITIACQDVPNPKHNIPRGYLTCVWTLFFTAFGTFFVCVSLPPESNALPDSLAPLQMGYHLIFQIPLKLSIIFTLPALYATAFGFMFFYGRQLRAMGNAGLVNPMIGTSLEKYKTPFNGLLFGSAIGYSICLPCFFFPSFGGYLFQMSMLCCTMIYLSQFASYVVFKSLLGNIKREYHSPLGVAGAMVGAVVFLLIMISIAFFQDDFYTLIAFVLFTLLSSIYYYLYVKDRQFFSVEEKTVLMAAHVVKCKQPNDSLSPLSLSSLPCANSLSLPLSLSFVSQHQ
jgi:ethanolamine permease